MAGSERYEFGEFTLDASERRLYKGGQALAVEPRSDDVLLALVRRARRLVTKRELMELVWHLNPSWKKEFSRFMFRACAKCL
jgi:DNA-binding winged helix-turn-helix (wHTH) protein